jgi:hypothetical protein
MFLLILMLMIQQVSLVMMNSGSLDLSKLISLMISFIGCLTHVKKVLQQILLFFGLLVDQVARVKLPYFLKMVHLSLKKMVHSKVIHIHGII